MIRLLIAAVVLIVLSLQLVETSRSIGISFLFAGLMAIYTGIIYKGREVMGIIFGGVILGTVVTTLIPSIWDSYKNYDYIGAMVLVIIAVLLWWWSTIMKKTGEMPNTWKRERNRRKTY